MGAIVAVVGIVVAAAFVTWILHELASAPDVDEKTGHALDERQTVNKA